MLIHVLLIDANMRAISSNELLVKCGEYISVYVHHCIYKKQIYKSVNILNFTCFFPEFRSYHPTDLRQIINTYRITEQ